MNTVELETKILYFYSPYNGLTGYIPQVTVHTGSESRSTIAVYFDASRGLISIDVTVRLEVQHVGLLSLAAMKNDVPTGQHYAIDSIS